MGKERAGEGRGGAAAMGTRRFALLLLGLFLVALVVRVGFVWQSADSDYYQRLVLDSATYHRIAVDGDPPEPYWQPPLYPWFLRGVYSLVGQPSPLFVRYLQAFLGAFGVVLLGLLVRRFGSPQAALIAAGAAALAGSLIYFDGELLPASLAALLVLAWLLILAWPGREGSGWKLARPAVAGLILGLLGLLLPSMAVAGGLVLLWLWRREGVIAALVLALAAAIPILPVTIRNQTYEPDLVPVSWNGGINFWIGNNPDFPETVNIRPGTRWGHIVERPRCEGGARTRARESQWFFREGLSYITSRPLSWMGDELRKAVATLSAMEIGRNRNLYDAREESWLMWLLLPRFGIPFLVIFPAFAAGLAALWRRRELPWLLLLTVAGILVVSVIFFPTARYRAPALPLMIAVAALGLRHLRWTDGAVAVIALGLSLFPSGIPQIPRSETYYEIAVDLSQGGKPAESLPLYERALELDPDNADIHLAYGLALGKMGQAEAGQEHLERAVQLDPEADFAWLALGGIYRGEQNLDKARQMLEKAVEADPCNPRHRASLAQVLMDQGLYRAAREQLEEARRRYPRRDRLVERAAERLERLEGMGRHQARPAASGE